ncbi:ACT domain-containing protein [Desulfovibrio inopinatus]|uniref:ACT domain-containing protein n=1 Tax=Desulfovibrio inopinatus TaxID=102109 RepID=UPI000418A408|nr:ACT domain-containing protein [Desulfovibrio inopinatus]
MTASPEMTILDLTVKNHPGVMSHICNLFARRAYNLDAIACLPVNGGENSRMLLRLREDERLTQIVRQVEKLHDVLHLETTRDNRIFETMNTEFCDTATVE